MRRITQIRDRLPAEDAGQMILMFVLLTTLLVAMAGFVLDVGYVWFSRRQMANAVDAAAMAGAAKLLETGSETEAEAEAADYATRNGISGADDALTVNFLAPKASYEVPPGGTIADCVEVVASGARPTFLIGVLGFDQWNVSARAVACHGTAPKDYGIITLNRTACQALEFSGNFSLSVTVAGTFTNSKCPVNGNEAAFSAGGSVSVTTTTNDVVGGARIYGSANITPPPTHAWHIVDPLANLPAPGESGGPALPTTVRSCNPQPDGGYLPGIYNCNFPGQNLTFAGGGVYIFEREFSPNRDVSFGPGVYVLRNGMRWNGNNRFTTNPNNGAMFYIESGCVRLNGTADLDLFPLTQSNSTYNPNGIYNGITFFQARTNTCTIQMNGNAAMNNTGIVYSPKARIEFSGNGTVTTRYQFIGDTFLLTGNGNVTINLQSNVKAQKPFVKLFE